eukprot:739397_1
MSSSPPSKPKKDTSCPPFSVDRQKKTPFLIRVFVHEGYHLDAEAFRDPTNLPSNGQTHIHTWLDATLFELAQLITQITHEIKKPNYDISLSFSLVYPDRKGTMVVKSCGKIENIYNNNNNKDGNKTLKQLKFEIGDFLDVNIHKIRNNNSDRNNLNDNRYNNSYGTNNEYNNNNNNN